MFILIKIILCIIFCIVIAHIITSLLNYRVSAYFGFYRWCHNDIHLSKLFYSFPVLIKNSPDEIREIFLKDLIEFAFPKALKLRPGCSVFILTHLLTGDNLIRLSENKYITYSKYKPNLFHILSVQLVALVAWLLRIIINRQLYSLPKIWGRKWCKITWSDSSAYKSNTLQEPAGVIKQKHTKS